MVITGRKKFSNVMPLSEALAADPLNHLNPMDEAKAAIRMTPETYSGVAEEAIEKVEIERSIRDPSRMPDRMPRASATGTIVAMTQNIRIPVRVSRVPTILPTESLNTEEKPQSPCKTPQKVGAVAGSCPRSMQRPVVTPASSV